MRHPAVVACVGLVCAALGVVAFSPAAGLPRMARPLVGVGLGLAALGFGVPPWRDQRHAEWVRNLGLFGWIPGLALVIAGAVVVVVFRLAG